MPDVPMAQKTDEAPVDVQTTNCVVVGGGPAGVMLAYLLARKGGLAGVGAKRESSGLTRKAFGPWLGRTCNH